MAERNRLVQLQDFDQSVWLDSISQGLRSGRANYKPSWITTACGG